MHINDKLGAGGLLENISGQTAPKRPKSKPVWPGIKPWRGLNQR